MRGNKIGLTKGLLKAMAKTRSRRSVHDAFVVVMLEAATAAMLRLL